MVEDMSIEVNVMLFLVNVMSAPAGYVLWEFLLSARGMFPEL